MTVDDEQPTDEEERLLTAVSALEAQRGLLGDDVVDASISALRRQLRAIARHPREQERKQITVLFADVSGFTAMAETRDAEEVGDLMNSLWARLDEVIDTFGGFIDKHIGDAVMALWGVKTAQETDPENAIRAALAMQEALSALRREFDHQLDMRIGINTGPVLLGEVGATAEFTAIGDTVNTADRLEKVAPVGGVLISQSTFQHVRGVFDVAPQEPISVKGKRDPLQVYIVKRAKARSFRTRRRGVEGVETRMIGRLRELATLQEALTRCIAGRERQVITISGEAGLGKSRLMYEFENWVDLQQTDVLLFRGRARSENRQIPFGLFRDLFAFRFDILEDDPSPVVRRKLVRGFQAARAASSKDGDTAQFEMRAHFIGHLLGYDLGHSAHLAPLANDPKQIRDRAFTYLQEYFNDAAQSDPLLVLFEDLQWADDSSLDMFADGAEMLEGLPLLVVATARPLFFERRPAWFGDRPYHRRLDLAPLPERENRQLVYEILKLAEEVPAQLRDLIVENSEGNPFYAEELVKMLVEEGVIVKGEESWRIEVDNLAGLHVPPTLAGILQARLDSLEPREQKLLRQASVIGRVFWDEALAFINKGDAQPLRPAALQKAINGLRARELIYKANHTTFSRANEYAFSHGMMREVAYESVLLRRRSTYHSLAADWLLTKSRERSLEMIGLTADHLVKADRKEEAADNLLLAGRKAAARFANDEAEAYLSRALALLPQDEIEARYEILRAREKVYHQLGNREEQAADLQALQSAASFLSSSEMANVALRFASYAEAISDYEAMRAAAQEAIAFVTVDGPPAILARAYLEWGLALERMGRYEEAHEQLERALALSHEASDQSLSSLSLRGLGIVSRALHNHSEAIDYFEDAFSQFVEAGDSNGQASTLIWLGVLCNDLGDISRARSYYEEALTLAQRTGYRYQESFALSNLGSNANYRGDYEKARHYIEQALTVAREIGNRIVESLCLNNLGTVNLNQEDYEAAVSAYSQSLQIAQEIGHRTMETSAATGAGLAKLLLGEIDEAIPMLQRGVDMRRELHETDLYESLTLLAYGRLRQGRPGEALAAAEEVLAYNVDGGQFYTFEFGLRSYVYLLQILEANADPRWPELLRRAYQELELASERIPDPPTRRAYLENVPSHRLLQAQWAARES